MILRFCKATKGLIEPMRRVALVFVFPLMPTATVPVFVLPAQDKVFESLEGEQLQPYMDAIELEGNAAQPMDEGGAEEEKVRHPCSSLLFHRA